MVHGMTCSACTDTVTSKIRCVTGVDACALSLVTGECQVSYDDTEGLSVDQIIESVEDCGFDCEMVRDFEIINSPTFSGKLHVTGMTCGACVSTVTKGVHGLDGVFDVRVSLVTEECLVEFDGSKVNIETIKEAVEDCGFDAEVLSVEKASQNKETFLKTTKIHLLAINYELDEDPAGVIESLKNGDCIPSVEFVETNVISVQYNKHKVGIREILRRLETMGYEANIIPMSDSENQLNILSKVKEIQFWKSTCFKSCFLAVFTMILYMGIPMISPRSMKENYFPYKETFFLKGLYYRDIFGLLIGTYIQFVVGSYFYKAFWNSLKHRAGTMDTLVCISTSCAYFFSIYSIICNIVIKNSNGMLPNVIFDTSVMLIAFISLGKLMENKAKSATSTALSKLISLTPASCTIVEDGNYENPTTIPIDLLQPGDIVEVKPGMKIPSDGKIIRGETEVDESLMTGESLLVSKEIASLVIGGSINGPGHFYFTATNVGEDSKLANIIRTMKQAQLTKAPIQRYADFLASVFVPSILSLALLTFIFWFILSEFHKAPLAFIRSTNGIFYSSFQIAISVVIVACPCALGLAAPTAIMVGTGIGAENQVLIKGGEVLEKFNNVKVFVFDKTGTLTTGNMEVKNFKGENDLDLSDEAIAVIKASEAVSEHPVARAIVTYCNAQQASRSNSKPHVSDVLSSKVFMGKGVRTTCELNGSTYTVAVGAKSLMRSHWEQSSSLLADEDNDYTVSYVSINEKVIGRFDIIDDIKKDSYQTIHYLNNHGFKTYMVTGDIHSSAIKVAQLVGMDLNNVYSEVEPAGKSEIVQQLMNKTEGKVIFVGDGINDSPALVTSDVGVAISTGTDIAVEAADIVILSDKESERASLKGLINALDIAQKTFRRIKLNIFWAVCYNTFMIPIAMGVLVPWGIWLHPMAAGLAMALSSVSVVLSSLMLKTWKPVSIDEDLELNTTSSPGTFWFRLFHSRPDHARSDIEMQEGLLAQ